MEFGGGHASRPSLAPACSRPSTIAPFHHFHPLPARAFGRRCPSLGRNGAAPKVVRPSGAAPVPPPLALHAPLMPQMVA